MSATWHMAVAGSGLILLIAGGGIDRPSGVALAVFVGASLAELVFRLVRAFR